MMSFEAVFLLIASPKKNSMKRYLVGISKNSALLLNCF